MGRHILGWTSLLLYVSLVCAQSGDVTPAPEDESPPKDIEVVRPGGIYSYGDAGVVMDERQNTVLRCSASGNPQPSYTWEFNGRELSSADGVDGGVLTISEPSTANEGVYQCFARNMHGTALSTKYNILMAYQNPFEDVSNREWDITEGNDATLQCGAPEGAPMPRIYWSIGLSTTPLVETKRIRYTGQGDLYFANVIQDDALSYFCFAGNDLLGSYMRSPQHTLVVADGTGEAYPAQIVHHPDSSVQGLRSQSFKMVCLASGFPTPTVKWLKGTTEKADQTLSFDELSFEDAGNYKCLATNLGGIDEIMVHLVVESAPFFLTEPSDIILAPGQSDSIKCDVAGLPFPSVKWLQNGEEIRETESGLYTIEGQYVRITDPREGDGTVFQCIASNEHGETLGSYTITILAIPATIREAPPRALLVAEETTLELSCMAFGSPTPMIHWQYNDAKIDAGNRVSIDINESDGTNSSTIRIVDIVTEDWGTYTCLATNSVGNSTASSTVSVKLPTSVELALQESVINRDQTAIFTCDVTKDVRSTVTVTWMFQGEEINGINQPGSRFAYTRSSGVFQVMDAVTTDTGDYACVATTDYDSANSTAMLTVQDRPSKPYNLDLRVEGLDATLSWVSGLDNNAEITTYTIQCRTQHATFPEESDIAPWKVLRTTPASSTTDSIMLNNYLTYSFRVLATNVVGSSNPSDIKVTNMTASAPPGVSSVPSNIRNEATSPGTLTISWDEVHPNYHNGPDFKYVLRWREAGTEEWHTEVLDGDATSFDIGTDGYNDIEYSVGVSNSIGEGPPATGSEGTTGEGTPMAAPGNVHLRAISPNEINVTWDSVPDEDVNGVVESYKIFYTMQAAQGSERSQTCPSSDNACVLGGLEAFTVYEISVAVANGHSVGPRSAPQTVTTSEGVPSMPVISSSKHTSYRISFTWNKPVSDNGVLLGYKVYIAEYDDNDVIMWHNETVDVDTQSHLHDAAPGTKHEIILTAYTQAGESDPSKADIRTSPAGAPSAPGKIESTAAAKAANLTWAAPDKDGPLPDQIKACYRFKDSPKPENCTDQYDALNAESIEIAPLEEGRQYVVHLVFKNSDGETTGEDYTFTTTGSGKSGNEGNSMAPWFIVIICIIIFLLLILLIICILKSQKGGKYNVSDKEKQLKDPENAPLKDNGGFPEYNNDTEFPDEVEGSQDSIDSHPDGSDGDSLKEYADDENPSKFNEEGSFIEEYHDHKPRSDIQGGTSTFV